MTESSWIKLKKKPTICYLPDTHFNFTDIYRLKWEDVKRYSMQMATKTILILENTYFQSKWVTRDKECCYAVIKRSNYQDTIPSINIYMHPTLEHVNI